MGSWNQTRALSNLPIRAGEKIGIVFLKQNMYKEGVHEFREVKVGYYRILKNGKFINENHYHRNWLEQEGKSETKPESFEEILGENYEYEYVEDDKSKIYFKVPLLSLVSFVSDVRSHLMENPNLIVAIVWDKEISKFYACISEVK